MFISAKPESLSVVIVVLKYPLTSFKVLFAHLLSAEVTGIVQAIRSKQVEQILRWTSEGKCFTSNAGWSECGLANSDCHFFNHLSTSKVWGLGRSDMYISDISSMFAFSRVMIMLGMRRSNWTAVF